jgi:Virulence factor
MPRRGGSEVVVILWRDIPAQVNAQVGRERHQVLLPDRFQRAIDRAKRKAKIRTAQEDVAQWRRISHPLQGDGPTAAKAEAARLDADYSQDRLGKLAFAGGWEHDVKDVKDVKQ